jgi:predicted nucleotide-binding protein
MERIAKRLGVKVKSVYSLIQSVADEYHLEGHVAALKLARDSNISIAKYASKEDLAELRSLAGGSKVQVHTAPASSSAPSRAKTVIVRTRPVKVTRNNSIFVVRGRDDKLADDMYAFLGAIGLNPIEWEHAIKAAKGGANPIIGNVIDNAMKKAQGILVLLSPDEDAKLKGKFCGAKDRKYSLHKLDGQPRPNVILEAGMALGAHSDKTILVQVGDMREISDIAGKHLVHLSNTAQSRKTLAMRLKDKLKFKVNIDGDLWLKVGNFKR